MTTGSPGTLVQRPSLGGGTRVVAYTYEADVQCIGCAKERFGQTAPAGSAAEFDENGIAYAQKDREGNIVHPVFATDESVATHCGCCGDEL